MKLYYLVLCYLGRSSPFLDSNIQASSDGHQMPLAEGGWGWGIPVQWGLNVQGGGVTGGPVQWNPMHHGK